MLRLVAAVIVVTVIYLHSPSRPPGSVPDLATEVAAQAKTGIAAATLRSGFVGDVAGEALRDWVARDKPPTRHDPDAARP